MIRHFSLYLDGGREETDSRPDDGRRWGRHD